MNTSIKTIQAKKDRGFLVSLVNLNKYGAVMKLTGKSPALMIANSVIVGLLESVLMTSLYPVIAIGLGERTKTIDKWLLWTSEIGFSENQTIIAHLLIFLGLGVTCSAARWLGEGRINSYRNLVEKTARLSLAKRLTSMRWNSFLKLGTANSLSELSNSSEKVADGTYNLIVSVSMLTTSVILSIALLIISPLFSLLLSVLLIAAIVAQNLFGLNHNVFSVKFRESHQNLGAKHSFLVQNFKYCRSTGYASHLISKMTHDLGLAVNYFDRERAALAKHRILIESMAFGAIASILGVVYFMQAISFSQASIFLAVLYRMTPRAILAFVCYQNARSLIPFLKEWLDVYNKAKPQDIKSTPVNTFSFQTNIVLNNVTYSFDKSRAASVKGISLEIKRDTFTGIVGKSGSGKTTIIDILSGLIPPDEGLGQVDGIPIYDIANFQNNIGIVHQTPTLIEGTILANIAFMDESPDRDWAFACARIANADEFIARLPLGLDQVISTENSLSGGQAQRLCLARALYNKPSILLLDEPTSALDQESEQLFIESLSMLKGSLTIVMATHRLSTLKQADQIIHLCDGRIQKIEHYYEQIRRSV